MTSTTNLPTLLSLLNVTAAVYSDRTDWLQNGTVYASRPHTDKRAMVAALRKAGYRR